MRATPLECEVDPTDSGFFHLCSIAEASTIDDTPDVNAETRTQLRMAMPK